MTANGGVNIAIVRSLNYRMIREIWPLSIIAFRCLAVGYGNDIT